VLNVFSGLKSILIQEETEEEKTSDGDNSEKTSEDKSYKF
jgi:hypothetical protein